MRHQQKVLGFFDTFTPGNTFSAHKRREARLATSGNAGANIAKMGKSNKFDYTNRSSSGAKLGDIIGKALVKEAKKVESDAQKRRRSSRKQSTDSTRHSSDAKEAANHRIDLKAPEKALGDEGLFALAQGLECALRAERCDTCLQLEDLNLSGNNLTTRSLARLASIIRLATYDLKTLNLSNNDITVVTEDEAQDWEVFLSSFQHCRRLRRLDLCGNHLGPRAFEILLRVHSREPTVDPLPPGGQGSVISLIEEEAPEPELENVTRIKTEEDQDDIDGYGKTLDFTFGKDRMLSMRCGLRSLPYLTLQKVTLTDSAALWLSFILEDHHYPVQLIDELNGTLASSAIRTYQQDSESKGLDWDANDESLSKDGAHLLQRTELLRRRKVDQQDVMSSSMISTSGQFENLAASTPSMSSSYDLTDQALPERKPSLNRRDSRAGVKSRRYSVLSTTSADISEHEISEVDSARRKIQRQIIATNGASSVELWRSGLAVVAYSRLLLILAPMTRRFYTGETMFKAAPAPEAAHVSSAVTGADEIIVPASPTSFVDETKISSTSDSFKARRLSYAATLAVQPVSGVDGEPLFAVTEATNVPAKPKVVFRRSHATLSEDLDGLVLRDDNPERFLKYQRKRVDEARMQLASSDGTTIIPTAPATVNPYRDEANPSHLTQALIEKILAFTISDRSMAVLSAQQRREAVSWGQDRGKLTLEREWRKKDGSAQVWMLLDGVKCLTYESQE